MTIAYDPDNGTKHLNPVYDKPDWAKGFDVVIHDECSSDVKDMDVVNAHPQAAPRGAAGRGAALRDALLPHRRLAQGRDAVVRVHRLANHRPRRPVADRRHYVDKESPITKGMEDWTTINEELYNNIAGKVLDTAHPAGSRQAGQGRQRLSSGPTRYNKKTHVFSTTLGHNNETVADDRYLDLVTRGLLWATGHLTDDGKPAPGYEAKK